MDQKKDQNTRNRKDEEKLAIVCIGDSIVEGYPYGEQYRRWCAEEGEIAYYVDGIHPTRKGYEKIAAFVCEKLPHMNSRLENTIEGEEAMR